MSSRELIEVKLESYNFSFFVVRLPEDILLDRLAINSPQSGLISRIEYQNFIFNETVVNLDRLYRFIADTTGGDREEIKKIRDDVESLVYGINPTLDPNILIITKNGVIKPSSVAPGEPLPSNPDWDKGVDQLTPYLFFEELDIIDSPEDFLDAEDIFVDEDVPVEDKDDGDGVNLPSDIPVVEKKWVRSNLILGIRKFTKDQVGLFLNKGTVFNNELLYKVYITRYCVVDAEKLYMLIESMGMEADVPKDKIVGELYDICIGVNPFLDFKDLDISKLPKPTYTSPVSSKQKKKKKNAPMEPKSSRRFSDVTREELLSLSSRVNEKIVGQSEAVEKMVETVQIASCGLRDPEKPVAVYMLCGTTGVGKTLLAKIVAEELCGSKDALIRVDCSEYSEAHSVQKIIGAPPSYVGYEDGGYLTNAVQEHPFSVILFDEIEKAHSKLFDLLLQVMDDSRLTDGKGNVTSFKDCLILFTSNIGVSEADAVRNTMGFGDAATLTEERRDKALKEALKKRFRPEFLNRIDSTINFKRLTREDAVEVTALLLEKVSGYLRDKNIDAEFTNAVKELVAEKGFSKKLGARPLERTVETEVVKPLAQMMLTEKIKENSHILVDVVNGEVTVTTQKANNKKGLNK